MGIGLDAQTGQRESGPQHLTVMHPDSHPLELELELQFYIKKQRLDIREMDSGP